MVTERRQRILTNEDVREALRAAIIKVRASHPFEIEAWVLLPDHLHCIWTLPEGDADFSMRWRLIKREVTVAMIQASRFAQAQIHPRCPCTSISRFASFCSCIVLRVYRRWLYFSVGHENSLAGYAGFEQ